MIDVYNYVHEIKRTETTVDSICTKLVKVWIHVI